MKRKLITLFVAFLVLAGFQTFAQTPPKAVVSIQTGDSISWTQPNTGGGSGALFDNERGGYAGKISNLTGKLTIENGVYKYRTGAPSVAAGSADRITVTNPSVNYISFAQGINSSTGALINPLTLSYSGVNHYQFVVFKSAADDAHVLNYVTPNLAATAGAGGTPDPSQVISPQIFNNGDFEGFLAIQASGMVDDGNLLIVVHNGAGDLKIVPYSEYVASITTTGTPHYLGPNVRITAKTASTTAAPFNVMYPLFVKSTPITGRWARPSDFVDCEFHQFVFNGAALEVYDAAGTRDLVFNGSTNGRKYSVFTVKQVDFVSNANTSVTNNIITTYANYLGSTGATFQGLNADILGAPWYGTYYGTAPLYNNAGAVVDNVIPLFTLASPENNCKVLSVSRMNQLFTETQMDGGYASRLEVRDYGQYYDYLTAAGATTNTYTSHTTNPTTGKATHDRYTSLQKFAIWIEDDGSFTLYPTAAYFWEYGEFKEWTAAYGAGQPDNIRPNAVLLYNDINVSGSATPGVPADKVNGLQIGWWNGFSRQVPYQNLTNRAAITTIPNRPQTYTDYQVRHFGLACQESFEDLSGRFYFLQVLNPDTAGLWSTVYSANIRAAFGAGAAGYQRANVKTEYVLSTQLGLDGYKYLAIVPKEDIMAGAAQNEYWSFPYDSVNMAAHWEIQRIYDNSVTPAVFLGNRIINMLGDTLQFNIVPPAVGYLPTSNNRVAGGYLPINGLWAGASYVLDPAGNAIPGHSSNYGAIPYYLAWGDPNYSATKDYLLGRPKDTGLPWQASLTWFNWNPEVNSVWGNAGPVLWPDGPVSYVTYDLWKFHQLKDPYRFGLNSRNESYSQKAFVIELTNHGLTANISLKTHSTGLGDKNWFRNWGASIGSGPGGRTYYQQYVDLDITQNVILNSYVGFDFQACGGMVLSLEEIKYVPEYGPFRPDEIRNNIVNTNDPSYFKQDSLTAYTFLQGNYDLNEALDINNGLKLTYQERPLNDGTSRTTYQAILKNTSDDKVLEFIPLSGAVGQQRAAAIQSFGGPVSDIDLLYGETYKWYLVRTLIGGQQKYLTFDTVNIAARTNREKVGLVFQADLTNATPVRLYQPLVGDKKYTNFLIQFYLPEYTYHYNASGTPWYRNANTYPNIESGSTTAAAITGGGEVCFATLSNESKYLFAARAYTSTTSGTRFGIVDKPNPFVCTSEFIDPLWMVQNHLLSLPLGNQVWVEDNAVTAWIAKGAAGIAANSPVASGGKRTIISNTAGDAAITTLEHTYVTSIKIHSTTGADANIAKVGIPANPGDFSTYQSWIGGTLPAGARISRPGGVNFGIDAFERDLEVPLYYVQNDEGLYLTVVPATEMRNDYTTVSDVNGIRLEWKSRIAWSATFFDNYGYDPRVVQLFAISGCKELKDGWFGKFIYLPLASFVVNDYKDGSIIKVGGSTVNDVEYNWSLGKGYMWGGNDIRDCWRISQWAPVAQAQKDMIVVNAKNQAIGGSLVPVEFKLKTPGYIKPSCADILVQNIGVRTAIRDRFYAIDELLTNANDYSLFAHWELSGSAKDDYLFTLSPELKTIYNKTVGLGKDKNNKDYDIQQTNLTGEYYFVKTTTSGGKEGYLTINVKGSTSGNYVGVLDTLKLTCVNHKVPFYDLEDDYNIDANHLAILETPFVDRNLTWKITDTGEFTIINSILQGYQAYIQSIGNDFNKAQFLTVYRENRRELTSKHIVPYYSFSVTNKVEVNGKIEDYEYFLNVTTIGGKDSVYWTRFANANDRDMLLDWENYPNAFPTYKFCLPYKWVKDKNGEWVIETAKYSDGEYPAVYLQTYDTAVNDYPFLVIAGSATKYVTARHLEDAIPGNPTLNSLKYNIYSVDYTAIDPLQVTAWIFGGPIPNGELWVPIADVINKVGNEKEGTLTNYGLGKGGVSFVTESEETPVNYGILTGAKDAQNLKVKFKGDAMIGSWALRKIWYYNVIVTNKGNDELFLTDASRETVGGPYYINFKGNDLPYGWFSKNELPEYASYATSDVYADRYFLQTFGFKYVIDDKDPAQAFYVVSNANFTTPKVENYRYLAEVNNQLVFVDKPEDALVFQWGKLDSDNNYTGLDKIGKGGIFGVVGGVKLINTTGKVDILSIDGRLIKSVVLTGAETTIPASRGIVLVKNGTNVVKVVVQ